MTHMIIPDPPTTPYGLPAVRPAPAPAIAVRPAQTVDIYTGDTDDEPDLEAALLVRRIARQRGLPRPLRTEPFPGQVVLSLPWPHLLQWIDMLDGFGQAEERGEHLRQSGRRFYVDDKDREWMIEARVSALPHHQRSDFAVHGWIDVDDGDGGTRRQQCVLSPVAEHGHPRSYDLPDTSRAPLSPPAYRDDRWWQMVEKRWDEETGFRAQAAHADLAQRWEAAHADLDAKHEQARALLFDGAGSGGRRPSPQHRTEAVS